MSNADDRCAREGCGAERCFHGAAYEANGGHAFVEPAPQPEPSGETAEQLRTRLGWPALTEEQRRVNLEQNLQSLGVTGGERRKPEPSGDEGCKAPKWCGTNCLGPNGPGLNSVLGVDYVRGVDCELFCSVACRDKRWPGRFLAKALPSATIEIGRIEFCKNCRSQAPQPEPRLSVPVPIPGLPGPTREEMADAKERINPTPRQPERCHGLASIDGRRCELLDGHDGAVHTGVLRQPAPQPEPSVTQASAETVAAVAHLTRGLPREQPEPSGDEAKVRDGALFKMANLAWSDIMREKGDIAVVDAVVRDVYATGLRDAALLVEFADLFWHDGDPRTRIATELRKRAADAIARRGSEGA